MNQQQIHMEHVFTTPNGRCWEMKSWSWVPKQGGERDCIQAYLSIIQHKSPEIICSSKVTLMSQSDMDTSFIDPGIL